MIKCMHERLKPGPFSSSSSSGLGTRLVEVVLLETPQVDFSHSKVGVHLSELDRVLFCDNYVKTSE